MAELDKFEQEDLPRILAALKTAKESQMACEVTVKFTHQGGVIDILYRSEKRFK
jgi:hypothetical protein